MIFLFSDYKNIIHIPGGKIHLRNKDEHKETAVTYNPVNRTDKVFVFNCRIKKVAIESQKARRKRRLPISHAYERFHKLNGNTTPQP